MAFERITVDPVRMGGLPTVRETRVTVGMVFGRLASGRTIDEVLADYPYFGREDVLASLEYAAAAVNEREVPVARRPEMYPGPDRFDRWPCLMGERRSRVDQHGDEIADAVGRHRGRSVAIFGSVARGEDTDDSDIDLFVDFEPGSSLFDLLHLQDELAALLGCPVDVVSAGGLKPRDEHIRREALAL
jgi:predicted nucleotidyltransferase/uncharacterized protein (DUF433 family)